MAVIIRSHINAQAGGNEKISLTTPVSGIGTVQITDVIGLSAVLAAKLDDVVTQVGQSNVTATGEDLNLLTGTDGYGLTTADLEKLADVTVSAAELNELAGITDNVQDQLDGKIGISSFTAPQQIVISAGTLMPREETLDDVLDGTFGTGYSYNDLKLPDFNIDANSKLIVNVLDPIDGQDAATKKYVDDGIGGAGGPYLPLTGGEMIGGIDLNGNTLVLDANGGSFIRNTTNDEFELVLGSNPALTIDSAGVSVHGQNITDVLDPINDQDAVTKIYADTAEANSLPLAGGVMSGAIDMDGNDIIMDIDGNSKLEFSLDNTFGLYLGGDKEFMVDNSEINAHNKPITNLANPIAPQDAMTMAFTDLNYLHLAGGTMNGNISMGTNDITNAGTISNASHQMDATAIMSSLGGSGYYINATASPTALAPNYAFVGASNTGMLYNGTDISFSHTGGEVFKVTLDSVDLTGNKIENVLNPAAPQDAATKNYVDSLINGGGFLATAGGTMTGDIDMGGNSLIMNANLNTKINFSGNNLAVIMNGDTAFSVDASVDVWGRMIENVSDPSLAQDAATKNYVDIQISSNVADKLPLAGGTMTGGIDMATKDITNVGIFTTGVTVSDSIGIRATPADGVAGYELTANASLVNPTYSFTTATDSGITHDSNGIITIIGGVRKFEVRVDEVDAHGSRIVNVADPIDAQDAMTLNSFRAMGNVRVLGKINGVDLMSVAGAVIEIYTVPATEDHIITQVLLRTSSYVGGVSPTDPIVSIGNSGGSFDQIVNNTTTSWGVGGAANQVIYLDAKVAAASPNPADVVSLRLDTPAGGDFTSIVVDVFVLGYVVE